MRRRAGSGWVLVGLVVLVLLVWSSRVGDLGAIIEATVTDRSPGKEGSRISTISYGEPVMLEMCTVPGKITIFDFYSDGCPPCVRFAPILHAAVEKDPALALKVVDINRKGQKGIDWGSPVAKQHQLSGIPFLVVFDGNGTEVARGDGARVMLESYFSSTSR